MSEQSDVQLDGFLLLLFTIQKPPNFGILTYRNNKKRTSSFSNNNIFFFCELCMHFMHSVGSLGTLEGPMMESSRLRCS